MAYPLPPDPMPRAVDSLIDRLPADARSKLGWFPGAFRLEVVEPARRATAEQVPSLLDELTRPAARLLLRLGRATAELVQAHPATMDALAPGPSADSTDATLRADFERRLSPHAASELVEAHAWMRAIVGALWIDYRTRVRLQPAAATPTEDAADDVRASLSGPGAATVRATLSTVATVEAALDERAPPPTLELWCRLAWRESHAAANALRAQGLSVPTSVLAPARSRHETVSLVRTGVLPPGAMERILTELRPDAIWLFGSRARGAHGPESDWDLLAVVPDDDTDVAETERRPVLDALRRERIDLQLLTGTQFESTRDDLGTLAHIAATQGRAIYDRSLEDDVTSRRDVFPDTGYADDRAGRSVGTGVTPERSLGEAQALLDEESGGSET